MNPYSAYNKTKRMPPLKDLAKKLEQQVDRVESGSVKVKQKESHEQEAGITKSSDAGTPQKRDVRHSDRIQAKPQGYQEEMAGQEDGDKEEDTTVRSGVGGVERLPRKRTFEELQLAHQLGVRAPDESRKTMPYTGRQPGAIAIHRNTLEQPIIISSGGEESKLSELSELSSQQSASESGRGPARSEDLYVGSKEAKDTT